MPNKECPGLKPPETDLCVEKPSCSGDSQVLADSVSLILSHEKENYFDCSGEYRGGDLAKH